MPELPEVQTIVNELIHAGLIGVRIERARVFWPRTIVGIHPRQFARQIQNRTIGAIRRRAKYIVVDFQEGGSLLIHLRMTGRLHLAPPHRERSKHEHVIVDCSGRRQLRLHDTRKFARLHLVDKAEIVLGHLGPEPLEPAFTLQLLSRRLQQYSRQVKPLLLDQIFIAGLGNIYTDEALWDAGIHPCCRASSLTRSEIKALHRAIPRVLQRGLKNLGTSLGTGTANFYSVGGRSGRNQDQLRVFRRTGQPCLRCGTPIARIIVAQRSTHLCPVCQKPTRV